MVEVIEVGEPAPVTRCTERADRLVAIIDHLEEGLKRQHGNVLDD